MNALNTTTGVLRAIYDAAGERLSVRLATQKALAKERAKSARLEDELSRQRAVTAQLLAGRQKTEAGE